MGNAAAVSFTNAAEFGADRLMAVFTQVRADGSAESFAAPLRIAERVQLNAGPEPGYAVVSIPMDAFPGEEDAFAVALSGGGPLALTRPNVRATVVAAGGFGPATPLLCGTVVDVSHGLGDDSGVLTILDDRWLLEKYTVFGQLQYDPRTLQNGFAAAEPCVFNALGLPNCIDAPLGPRFAPAPRYGWAEADTAEPEPGAARERARSWRAADAVAYLRAAHYEAEAWPGTGIADYGTRFVPAGSVAWPVTLGEQLCGAESSTGERALHECALEGATLKEALVELARRAGPYELCLSPGSAGGDAAETRAGDAASHGASTLGFVSLSRGRGGVRLRVPGLSGETIESAAGGNGIAGGFWLESIRDYHDAVAVLGDPPAVERLLSMDPADTTASARGGLEAAWSAEDEAAFLSYVDSEGRNERAFAEAALKWPLVFAAYRVPAGYDYLAGTKWNAMGAERRRAHPRIRPTLLTGANENETAPRTWQPRAICIEYKNGSTWQSATPYDSLEVSLDGGWFYVPALRDSAEHPTWSGAPGDPLNIAPRQLRATLALECEFRIAGRAGAAEDPNGTGPRLAAHGGEAGTTYVAVPPPLVYGEWLRVDAAPLGQALGAQYRDFPDRAAAGEELFSDIPGDARAPDTRGRLPAHAAARLREVKRIAARGQLVFERFEPALLPGARIAGIDGAGFPVEGVVTGVTLDAEKQTMTVELG